LTSIAPLSTLKAHGSFLVGVDFASLLKKIPSNSKALDWVWEALITVLQFLFYFFLMDREKDSWHSSGLHLAVTAVGLIYFNLKPINYTVSLHMHVLECTEIDKNIHSRKCISYSCLSLLLSIYQLRGIFSLWSVRLFESDCFLGFNI